MLIFSKIESVFMLFLALGKAKGPAEVQTAKPDLIITLPPGTDKLDPDISWDVYNARDRKGFEARIEEFNDGSRSRSLHQGMQAPSPSKPDPVIIPTVEKRKFFRGLFKLSFIRLLFFLRKVSFRKHR